MTEDVTSPRTRDRIGATALAIAAARAVDTNRLDGLVDDPYAVEFVRAGGSRWRMPTSLADPVLADADDERVWRVASTYFGLRARFFDDWLTEAASGGVEQIVALAAGLDSRAYRLPWPADRTVFEVDQASVLDFKAETMRAFGATPRARSVPVEADLRGDWPAALRAAGFDPGRPTAWLLEGLLMYLPAAAEDGIWTEIFDLSAPGSGVGAEYVVPETSGGYTVDPGFTRAVARLGIDFAGLMNKDPRPEVAARLRVAGWTVASAASAPAVAEAYGRPIDDDPGGIWAKTTLLTAAKP